MVQLPNFSLEEIINEIRTFSMKQNIIIDYDIIDPKVLLKNYLHGQGNYPNYDESKEYKQYKEFTPEAFCDNTDGKIYINSELTNGGGNLDKFKAVLIHESQHSASNNHRGFQQGDVARESFLMDEATTDYFAKIIYDKVYPESRNYLALTNYFTKNPKGDSKWQGEAIEEMLNQNLFNADELKKAYYLGDQNSKAKIGAKIREIDAILVKYKSN